MVLARNLLEILVGQNPVYFPLQFLAHYPLAYIAPLLALVLVLHVCSGVAVERLTRLMLYVWALTLLPPLVDLAAGRGGEAIGYLRLEQRTLTDVFVRFFDPRESFGGTTVGIRVETAAACLLGGLYVWMRRPGRDRWLRAPVAMLGVYICALGFFTLPRLFATVLSPLLPGGRAEALYLPTRFLTLGEPAEVLLADRIGVLYLVPLCLLLGGIWLSRADPDRLRRTLATAPPAEMLRSGLLAAAGIVYGAAARPAVDGSRGSAAPGDLLAAGGLVLGVMLLVWGTEALRKDPPSGAILALSGLILAAGSGTPATLLAASAAGLHWVRRAAPLSTDRYWLAGPLTRALVSLSVLAAGASWGLQVDGLAALAPRLAVALLLAEALFGLAEQTAAGEPPLPRLPAGPARLAGGVAGIAGAVTLPLLCGAPPLMVAVAAAAAAFALLPRLSGAPRPRMERAALAAVLGLGLAAVLVPEPARAALVEAGTARPKLVIRRAMALEREGARDAALSAYRRALRLDPESAPVHARLGELLRQAGDLAGARRHLESAVAHDAGAVAARQQLGVLLLDAGETVRAEALLAEAAALAPRDPVVLATHAEALTRLPGQEDAATGAWRRYLAASDGRPEEDATRTRARSLLLRMGSTDSQ